MISDAISPDLRQARRRHRLGVLTCSALLILALLSTLLPIYFIVKMAFSGFASQATNTLAFTGVSLVNFEQLFSNPTLPFVRWFVNSLVISLSVTVLTTFVVAMSAYAFSRLRFRGRDSALQIIVLLQVFPNLLAVVAVFLIVQQLGATEANVF